MESKSVFHVKVEYLGVDGSPKFKIVSVLACTKWHAIELVHTEMMSVQPNRQMYQVYTPKHSKGDIAIKRCTQVLAGYAHCYAMTYN